MSGIQTLDCTLRDGGYLNDWEFGNKMIRQTIRQLVASNVDFVELGFLRNEDYQPDRTVFRHVKDAYAILPEDCGNTKFTLMSLHNKYDISQLEDYDGGPIKRIRVTFHDYDVEEGLEYCRKVMDKGYEVSCNPINIMGYSDEELLKILKQVDAIHPTVFSIVDTFGSMKRNDLIRLYSLCENNLSKDVTIGLHLHENLSLSYSLAQEFLNIKSYSRNCVIDGSLLGMGRVPGNLCIELILDYLNNNFDKTYNIDPILDAIDDYIVPIKKLEPWGYSTAYSLSAKYNLHRNYAEFLLNKGKLKAKDINHILASIADNKKTAFDQEYVEELYYRYQDCAVDDSAARQTLAEQIKGRKLLILAPGGSLEREENVIREFIEKENPLVITANFRSELFSAEALFFSNVKRYEEYVTGNEQEKILVTSNIKEGVRENVMVFNYHDLTYDENGVFDNCTVMLLRLLKQMGIREVYLAGFDGYEEKPTDYVSSILDYQERRKGAAKTNKLIRSLLAPIKSQMNLVFLTHSKYEEEA